MEISDVVFRSVPCLSPAGVDYNSQCHPSMAFFSSNAGALRLSVGRGSKSGLKLGISEYRDNGHKQYYSRSTSVRCGGKKREKTKLKLVKNLSKDLCVFSQIGFGLDPDNGLIDQVKSKMISEATDLLLEQLKQLKMEEKELKRQRKEEKAKLKAARMENRLACESSSSSSSESSDSERGEVVKSGALAQSAIQESSSVLPRENVIESQPQGAVSTVVPSMKQEQNTTVEKAPEVPGHLPQEHGTKSSTTDSNLLGSVYCRTKSSSASDKKIEVCMGGKCKKSGGAVLLEEFQKAVGVEGAAGCKCMGKCRDGPNVKVLNSSVAVDDNGRTPNNPLCVGVGLEDVGLIVANFFGGESQRNLSLASVS